MIDFNARVKSLRDKRDSKNRELDGSIKAFAPDHMAEQRAKVAEDFDAGLVALGSDYDAAVASISNEIAAAKFDLRMAASEVREPWVSAYHTAQSFLHTLSPAELAAFYEQAIAKGNIGAQIAVETFKPNFAPDDRTTTPAMRAIAAKAPEQQALRTSEQQKAVKASEDRLKKLKDEYSAATTPLIAERARSQYRERSL